MAYIDFHDQMRLRAKIEKETKHVEALGRQPRS